MELTGRSGQLKIRTREARLFNRKFCINQAITLFAGVERPRDLVDAYDLCQLISSIANMKVHDFAIEYIHAFDIDTLKDSLTLTFIKFGF